MRKTTTSSLRHLGKDLGSVVVHRIVKFNLEIIERNVLGRPELCKRCEHRQPQVAVPQDGWDDWVWPSVDIPANLTEMGHR